MEDMPISRNQVLDYLWKEASERTNRAKSEALTAVLKKGDTTYARNLAHNADLLREMRTQISGFQKFEEPQDG